MGNFYTNFAVRTSDAAGVAATLKKASRSALVSPMQDGYVVVFDEVCDKQNTKEIKAVGSLLSGNLGCHVLAVLDHDDDVLCYWLFENGREIDSYTSAPDYFARGAGNDRGGDVDLLCKTLGVPAARTEVEDILFKREYGFAMDRHAKLVAALRLPSWTVCGSFEYIEQDETPDGLSVEMLVRTP